MRLQRSVLFCRKSILGFLSASPFLYAFDAATIMLGAFCSVSGIIIIYLLNSAMAKAIKQLRKQVDELTTAAASEACTSDKVSHTRLEGQGDCFYDLPT